MNQTVSIVYHPRAKYPTISPFHPPQDYPEYVFKNKGYLSPANKIYPMVRECLYHLGLDRKHYGTNRWNPLGELIKPGNKIVLKPNFVRDYHESGKDIYSVITHPSIIRAIVDYAYTALKGKGEIIIADTPLGDTDFGEILDKTKLFEIKKLYRDNSAFEISILDLRKTQYQKNRLLPQSYKLKGDPLGYQRVNLGKRSSFAQLERKKTSGFISPGLNGQGVFSHPRNGYLISKTLLSADVVISLPKLKVHKKAGVTLNLKNMLGTCGDKACLFHFREGSPAEGGDEFPVQELQNKKAIRQHLQKKIFGLLLNKNANTDKSSVQELLKYRDSRFGDWNFALKDILKVKPDKMLGAGDWYGNDTIWRTILDINEIIQYADRNGKIHSSRQRNFFSLIDGIIAGEKEGPLNPSPKRCGVLISGFDFLAVDLAAIKTIGFDYKKIPQYRRQTNSIRIKTVPNNIPFLLVTPPQGWKGKIESKN